LRLNTRTGEDACKDNLLTHFPQPDFADDYYPAQT
jgi:hypothetical protein